jgi:hypothetical protein
MYGENNIYLSYSLIDAYVQIKFKYSFFDGRRHACYDPLHGLPGLTDLFLCKGGTEEETAILRNAFCRVVQLVHG